MARETGKWFAALALFAALLAMLSALQLYQVTSRGVALPALRRATASLTEIDPWLDAHYDSLQESARASSPGERVPLPDYLIDVGLRREDVDGASKAQLRALILDRSANALYADGTGVLRAEGAAPVGRFTSAGVVDASLDLLRERNHDVAGVLVILFAGAVAVAAGALASLTRGFGRLTSIGATLLAASATLLLGGLALRLYMAAGSGSSEEYPRRDLLDIGEALAWIPLRNGLGFTALGIALLALGALGALATARGGRGASVRL